jgi:NADPH2:quinone reductase
VTKARVVSLTELGSADVIKVIDKELPPPAKSEVQIRQTAIGFNFIDVYQRSGVYPLEMPTGLGLRALLRLWAMASLTLRLVITWFI